MHWVSRWVSLRSTHPTKLRSAPGINTRNAVDSPVSQGVYSFPPAHEGTLLEAILRWSSRAVRGGDSPRVVARSRKGKPVWRRGARGRASDPRTREALGARPLRLRGAAFNGCACLR